MKRNQLLAHYLKGLEIKITKSKKKTGFKVSLFDQC